VHSVHRAARRPRDGAPFRAHLRSARTVLWQRAVNVRSMLMAVLFVTPLFTSGEAAAAEEPEAPPSRTSLAVRAGPYWMVDRDERMFDGPAMAVGVERSMGRGWGAALELGTAGELAGGRGTCLAELSLRAAPSITLEPGPAWLHFVVRAGPGVVWARVYGSLFGATTPTSTAYGDRVLPELGSSFGATASLGRWTISTDLIGRWLPSATFHADHLPPGAMSEFYPTFRHDHDLSTYGVTAGVAFRF
jgi:hypothetical protein